MMKDGYEFPLYDAAVYERLSSFVLHLPQNFPLKGESYHLLSRYLSAADLFLFSKKESRSTLSVFNLAKFSKLWEKLKTTRNDLYDDYPDGHALLQSLTELFLTVRKLIESRFTSEKERDKVQDIRYLFGLTNSPKKKLKIRLNRDDESAIEWMDGLYLAIDFLVNVGRFKPLSSLLVDKAILHTVPPTQVVESGHPYSIADEVQKVEIHSDETQSLQVVFDPKSSTHRFDILTIKSAGKQKDDEETFQFYGNFGDRRVPFQVSDISYSFKTAQAQEYVHGGVECDSCHSSPIKGARFKCANCKDFDICQDCEEAGMHYHDPKHVFFKIVRPLPPVDERPQSLIPFISDQETTDKTEPWECSRCRISPIVGPKWICANCDKLTVVCHNCEKLVTQTHFGGVHLWLKFHRNPSIDLETRTLPLMQVLYNATQYWGFKFKVIPELTPKGKKTFLRSKKHSMISSDWDHQSVSAIINQMVEFTNEWLDSRGSEGSDLETTSVGDIIQTLRDPADTLQSAHRFPLLLTLDEQHVEFICAVILQFNISLSKLLYVIEPRNFQVPRTIGMLVSQHKSFILLPIKLGILGRLIENTYVDQISPTVRLNRQEAVSKKLPLDEGEAIKNSIFLQVYRQLKDVNPERFRQEDQSWTVKFFNEGAEDAGGPYRESLVLVCAELQSPLLPLFIPCPNAKEGTGENRDKYIPNPDCTDQSFLQMYFFIGKLMGIAVRTKTVLDLDLPSFIWKPLVGEEQTQADLEAIDMNFVQLGIKTLENPEAAGITRETFSSVFFNTFVVTSASGKEVPLIERGSSIPVMWDNRLTYSKLALQYRLHECDKQIEALRKGMYEIIPPYIITLFSWKELEHRTCGKTDVDVELLRKNTAYRGLTENSPTVVKFWKVFESFTSEERCAFLRFVWGRSRLPASSTEFERKFELHAFERHITDEGTLDPDNFLPQAHTCFFSVEIPDYSTEEVMKKKLLYAITECVAIDTDYNPMEEDDEDDDYSSSDTTDSD